MPVDHFINAAAIWFLLKVIEILPMTNYDIGNTITRFNEATLLPDTVEEEPDANRYDSKRGKLEYILSGTGFADFRLRRTSKKWFLISTLVPMLIFVVELLSIYLGFERFSCKVSSDPTRISAPSLVLFGKGKRIKRVDGYSDLRMLEEDYGTPFGRPCVRWYSANQGVDYFAKVCGETASISAHVAAAAPELVLQGNQTSTIDTEPLLKKSIAALMPTTLGDEDFYYIKIYEIDWPQLKSKDNMLELGSIQISSQVIVGGKNMVVRNATSRGIVSPEKKNKFRRDLEYLDKLHKESHPPRSKGRPEYWEHEDMFGFIWTLETYMARGGLLMTYALLRQATIDSTRRKANNMSKMNGNKGDEVRRLKDTLLFCQDDLILSTGFAICVIVASIFIRLSLICVPRSVSSAEFALIASEEIANLQECSVFFMDRRRAVCKLRRSSNGVFNHVGYTSVGVTGNDPKLPWR